MVARRAPRSPSSSSPATPGSSQVQLPKLIVDPVWSLKPWPVVVTVAGVEYTIPAMCAADWLAVLMQDPIRVDEIFPGLLDDADYELVEEQLHRGELSVEEFVELPLSIIATVSGRPWWVALRLITTAQVSWDALGGEMVIKIDASRASLAGWLDVLYLLILRNIDDQKRNMFLLRLEKPPEGYETETAPMEMSADAFMAMAS